MDAIVQIQNDHRAVEQLFAQFEAYDATTAGEAKTALAQQIVRELSIHAAIEEQVLYPAMRDVLPDGDAKVRESLTEHQAVKELLAALERTSPDDVAFSTTVKAVMEQVRAHVEEEEGVLLPSLGSGLGPERMQQLGQALEAARRIAPTHPHPNAPNTGAAQLAAGAAAGVLDRARDLADKARTAGEEAVERVRNRT